MRYDKDLTINDLDGEPIPNKDPQGNPVDPKVPVLTFAYLCEMVLGGNAPDPSTKQPRTGAAKVRDARFAERIRRAQRYFDCTIEESAHLRKMLEAYPGLWVMRCWEIIDNPITQPAKQKGRRGADQSDQTAPELHE